MGIYIPNMEMPKSCVMCGLYTDKFTDDEGFILECALGEYERANCPLIEIDLVRCGECRHWYRNNPPIDEECDMLPNADDFCSYGERRADERTD